MPELGHLALGSVPDRCAVYIVEEAEQCAAEMRNMIKHAPATHEPNHVQQNESVSDERRTLPCPIGWGSP